MVRATLSDRGGKAPDHLPRAESLPGAMQKSCAAAWQEQSPALLQEQSPALNGVDVPGMAPSQQRRIHSAAVCCRHHEGERTGGLWICILKVVCRAGITRERLAGFDRKITEEPQDFPDRRDALITDFQHYLGIIKAVHEGADLQVSLARSCQTLLGHDHTSALSLRPSTRTSACRPPALRLSSHCSASGMATRAAGRV